MSDCKCGAAHAKHDLDCVAGKWLDAPDGDGFYWWLGPDCATADVVCVDGPNMYWYGPLSGRMRNESIEKTAPAKWQRVQPHTPVPPPPLPKSKTVTLTAKVVRGSWESWTAFVKVGENNLDEKTARRHEAIQWVRDMYGIEPEVQS